MQPKVSKLVFKKNALPGLLLCKAANSLVFKISNWWSLFELHSIEFWTITKKDSFQFYAHLIKKIARIPRIEHLEQRQYQNDSMESISIIVLKSSLFFTHLDGNGKSAAISKLTHFLTPSSFSYILLALVTLQSKEDSLHGKVFWHSY